jgi:hypothetical protein
MGYADVALLGQLVEMVAGDVGVDRKKFGDASAGHRLGRLPDRQVDAAPRRIAQRRRQFPDAAVETARIDRRKAHRHFKL